MLQRNAKSECEKRMRQRRSYMLGVFLSRFFFSWNTGWDSGVRIQEFDCFHDKGFDVKMGRSLSLVFVNTDL
jgi:hypothetical protein